MFKSNLGRKGFISAYRCSVAVKASQGGNSRQELNQKSWTNAGLLPTVFAPPVPAFLETPGPPTLKWHHPQWAGTSYIHH